MGLLSNIFLKPHPDYKVEQPTTDRILVDTRYFFLFQILMQGLVAMTTPTLCGYGTFEKIKATFIAIPIAILLHCIRYFFSKRGEANTRYHYEGIFFLYYTKYYNVWFYILTIGMITNNANKNYQGFNLISNFQDEHSFNYLGDMFKTFMISILAFLASNIINQMLGIKDGYDEMKKKGDQFVKDLKESEAIIKDMVQVNTIIAPINSLMSEVKKDGSKSLEKQVDLFTSNISDYTKALTTLNKNKDLRVWNFSLFNKYIESNRTYLEKYRTVFIPYEELKSVVSKFMKFALQDEYSKSLPIDKKHKFYALFAASPKAFFPDDNKMPLKSPAYCKWNFHIKQDSNNVSKSSKGINEMHRVFVSVNATNFHDIELLKVNVDNSLNSDAHNILVKLIADAHSHISLMHNSDNKKYQEKYIDDLKAIQTKFASQNLTIKDLLKEFHPENCAKILNLAENEKELILTGKDNKYVKDYFAIKRFDETKNDYIWSYCLAGEFHPDFKAIEINIYDEQMTGKNSRTGKSWDDVKADLEKIFNHSNIQTI